MSEPRDEWWASVSPISDEEIGAGVYVLHFVEPVVAGYAGHYGDARHYVGQSRDWRWRVAVHRAGHGAAVTRAAVSQGVQLVLGAVFPGAGVEFESVVARSPGAFCHICLRGHLVA